MHLVNFGNCCISLDLQFYSVLAVFAFFHQRHMYFMVRVCFVRISLVLQFESAFQIIEYVAYSISLTQTPIHLQQKYFLTFNHFCYIYTVFPIVWILNIWKCISFLVTLDQNQLNIASLFMDIIFLYEFCTYCACSVWFSC